MPLTRRVITAIGSISIVTVSACNNEHAPTVPRFARPMPIGLTRQLRDGEVWLHVSGPALKSSCAASIQSSDGIVRTVLLNRGILPSATPFIDSVPGRPGRAPILHVLYAAVQRKRPDGRLEQIELSCFAPKGIGNHRFGRALISAVNSASWTNVEKLIVSAQGFRRNEDQIPASRLLMNSVNPNAASQLPANVVSGRFSLAPNSARFDEYYGSDTLYRRPAQPVAPVMIQGTYVDWSELLRGLVKRGYSLSELGAFNVQYVATDCETASQAYYARQQALYETADEMEQDAAEMDSAAWAVQQFVCEPLSNVPNGAGKTICIDLFIMAPTMLLIGDGDGRPFDVNAKYTDSRAQLYINPTTLEHELMLNGTRIYLVKPPTDGGLLPIPWRWDPPSAGWVEIPPYRHLSRDVEVSRDTYYGRIIIRYSLYNGLATTMGRDAVPAIDARVTLHPLSNGQYYVEFYGDDYPSTQVNQMIDGQWTELARRPEHPGFFGPRFLTDMYPKANDIRNSNPLPPGCDLQ